MKKLLFLAIIILCLPVFSAEHIERFHADIEVNPDASLTITETITVVPENKYIKHGITRDLPTNKGERYKILSVQKDGYAEPVTYRESKYMAYLRIGSANKALLSGYPVTYVIKYKAYNTGLGRFENYDEVYWNVTGSWDFPINQASARVILPEGASFIQQASYRGQRGSRQLAAYKGDNYFSTDNLSYNDQLTVALGFTKGIIAEPTGVNPRAGTVSDKALGGVVGFLIRWLEVEMTRQLDIQNAIVIFGGVLIYFMIMWLFFGRDIYYQTPMVEYEAPKEVSPEETYLWQDKTVSRPDKLTEIHLLNLAQSGFIQIDREKLPYKFSPVYFIVRTEKEPQTPEEKFYDQYMKEDLVLDGGYEPWFSSYVNKLSSWEEKKFSKDCNRNWGKVIFGIILFALLIILTPRKEGLTIIWLFLFVMATFIGLFFTHVFNIKWRSVCIFYSLPLLGMIAMQILTGGNLFKFNIFYQFTACCLTYLLTIPFFAKIMSVTTKAGAVKQAKIKGLEMFLTTLNIKTPADFTKENAESLFPYAVALGVENKWKNRFRSLIGSALTDNTIYNSRFRHGLHNCASRSTTRSSGGGSSGGGCSGGGGGGGHGGGW